MLFPVLQQSFVVVVVPLVAAVTVGDGCPLVLSLALASRTQAILPLHPLKAQGQWTLGFYGADLKSQCFLGLCPNACHPSYRGG